MNSDLSGISIGALVAVATVLVIPLVKQVIVPLVKHMFYKEEKHRERLEHISEKEKTTMWTRLDKLRLDFELMKNDIHKLELDKIRLMTRIDDLEKNLIKTDDLKAMTDEIVSRIDNKIDSQRHMQEQLINLMTMFNRHFGEHRN